MICNALYLLPSGRPARFQFASSEVAAFIYVDSQGGSVDLLPSFAAKHAALVVPANLGGGLAY